jgi:hypothetical protein
MPEQETYVPLEKSAFWQDVTASAEELQGETFATKLHRLERLFFVSGTGDTWDGGRLVNVYKPGVKINGGSPPHRASESALQEDPEDNTLFNLVIPAIPAEEFMKELSDDPSLKLMADRVRHDRPVYPIDEKSASMCRIPLNADVHYLSALMMMCKHILLHPDRLEKGSRDKQLVFVRDALNTGFDVISKRGIEENFAKSCAELQKQIPFLTTFSEGYVQAQDKRWKQERDFRQKMDAMSPAEREGLRVAVQRDLRGLQKLWDRR